MNKKSNNLFYGVIAFILVAGAFMVSWLWITPQYTQNQSDLARTTYEVDAAKEKLDSLKSAKSTLTSLGSVVDQMFVAIPADKDTHNTITVLEAIAAKNGTYIPSFQISDSAVAAESTGNSVLISFSVSGSFENLTAFVKSVESDIKFFNVKSMTLSSNQGTVSMALQLEAFKQNNSASLSS